jgi:hypothetical protein
MASKKWIQKAVTKPGAFTDWCKSHGFNGPTTECVRAALKTAKKTGDKTLRGRALFALRSKKGF